MTVLVRLAQMAADLPEIAELDINPLLADADGVLDWFHVSEHVWEAARIVAPDAPEAWASAALDQLHDGGGTALQTWLEAQRRGSRGGSGRVRAWQ